MGCAESQDMQKRADSRTRTLSQLPNSVNSTVDTLASVAINLNAFRIEKVLGKGSFGKVLLVTKKDS